MFFFFYIIFCFFFFFFFSSRRRHTRSTRDWSSDVCSSDLPAAWASTPLQGGPMAVNPQAGPLDTLRGFGAFPGGGRAPRGGPPGVAVGQPPAGGFPGPGGVNGQVSGPPF